MQNINLANIDQILQAHGIDINSIPENQRRFHLMTVEEIKRLYEKNEILNSKLTLIETSMLNMQNRQNTADQHIANANGAINNTNAHLNALDARVTLTEQNLNILKDRVNNLAEQAIRNNEIPNPERPSPEEESRLKNILGSDYYESLKHNYMIATRDEIAKAAKEAINKAILACQITNVIYDERDMYRARQEGRNAVAQEGQRIEGERATIENDAQNLETDRAERRSRIAEDVRKGKVNVSTLTTYDQQTEEMRSEMEERRKKIQSDADLNEKDVGKLESEFVSTIKRIGANGSYIKEILELTGVVINVAESIKKYVEKKQAEAREEERFKIRAKQLETELIAMTIDGRKETFEKVNAIYLARYYATYDRNDKISFEKDHSAFPDRVSEKCGYRSFSNIPHFKAFLSHQGVLIGKAEECLKKVLTICTREELIDESTQPPTAKINNQDYHFSFVQEDKKEEFKIKYQLYRALSKLGEFDKIDGCGDKNEVKRALFYSLIPVFWVDGFYAARDRALDGEFWSRNTPNLKEVMKMYLIVAGRIEEILKTKCVYARLKYYNDWTKSEYGKNLLEKNEKVLNSEFPNENAKQKFEECFDLYQKIANEGIADRGNYVNNTFEFRNVTLRIVNQI